MQIGRSCSWHPVLHRSSLKLTWRRVGIAYSSNKFTWMQCSRPAELRSLRQCRRKFHSKTCLCTRAASRTARQTLLNNSVRSRQVLPVLCLRLDLISTSSRPIASCTSSAAVHRASRIFKCSLGHSVCHSRPTCSISRPVVHRGPSRTTAVS